MTLKLVKFENGLYGIRKGSLFSGYRFLDLKVWTSMDCWWRLNSQFIGDCMGDKEIVVQIYDILTGREKYTLVERKNV